MSLDLSSATVSTAAGMRAWLSSGAAQSPDGAFYAWLDESGRPSFEYPEITGYALNWFAGLDDPDEEETRAGREAERWLLRRLAAGDLSARQSWDGQAVYTFDLGMIATGLMAFGSRHGSDDAVSAGAGLALAIHEEIARTGTLRCLPRRPGNDSSRSTWSTEGLAHLLKTVQCLLWAGTLGREECVDTAGVLVRDSLRIQREDGRFLTHPSGPETMVHPHFYAVEGLWVYGQATGDREALRRARLATEWAWEHRAAGGCLPRWVDPGTGEQGPPQADLTAQALRAAVLLDVGGDTRAATADWLAAAAWRNGGTAAMPYQPGGAVVHRNTWSTLFAAQALACHADGPGALSWQTLV